jgi:hypothetical protein
MSNHRWQNDKCVHCGITRKRVTFKQLMAISDQPPYNHYQYSTGYIYIPNGTSKRPECNKQKQ